MKEMIGSQRGGSMGSRGLEERFEVGLTGTEGWSTYRKGYLLRLQTETKVETMQGD